MAPHAERVGLRDLEKETAAAVFDALDVCVLAALGGRRRAELLPRAGAAALDEDVDLLSLEVLVDEAVGELSEDPLRVAVRVDHVAAAVVRASCRDDHLREGVRPRALFAERRALLSVARRLRDARRLARLRRARRARVRAGLFGDDVTGVRRGIGDGLRLDSAADDKGERTPSKGERATHDARGASMVRTTLAHNVGCVISMIYA
jgi:hypothetical protein